MRTRLFRRREDDERGAAFVLTAISMVLLLWAGATGVDVGFTVYGSRQAQAMADTAAIDLARYINYADSLTSIPAVQAYLNGKLTSVLSDNGSNADLTVVPGYYNSSTGHFTVNGYTGNSCQPVIAPPINRPGCNAVEVTATQSVPQIFFGGFNKVSGHANAGGWSLAWQNASAGFSIGTYLVNLNSQQSAVLNALFSKGNPPLGSSVNLTAVGYDGLAYGDVSVKDLINASGGLLSTSNIMTAQLTAQQWLSIYLTAVGSDYGTGSTAYSSLQALGTFSSSASTDVKFCQLANINVGSSQYNCSNPSISQQGLSASVNVLQMLTTEAELANGTNAIDITSALNLTVVGVNIGGITLSTQVIQPAQYAYGPVGTTASDAQVQATLSMNLTVPILNTPIGTLTIPLSAATGTATLNTLTCSGDSLYSMALTVNTNTVSTGSSGNGITLTLLGTTTTQGSLSIGGLSNQGVTFTGPANPAGSDTPPTAATAAAGKNPESVGSTNPTLTFTAASGANGSVVSTMGVLDGAFGPVLQALGLTVGGATVAGFTLPNSCDSVSLA